MTPRQRFFASFTSLADVLAYFGDCIIRIDPPCDGMARYIPTPKFRSR